MVNAAQQVPISGIGRQGADAEVVRQRLAVRDLSAVPELWEILDSVADPEIPVISIWELGVLQDVEVTEENVCVTITPTYSGCPAMDEIAADIRARLTESGYEHVDVNHRLAPAWSTDWMTVEGRQKLLEYGIAPPNGCAGQQADNRPANCPQCGSAEVEVVSDFGSTACKALYRCIECREPFDYFKCL